MASRHLTSVLRGFALAVAVGLLGYLSNLVSVEHCEDATAREIAAEIGRCEVFVLPDGAPSGFPQYRGSNVILRRAGLTVRSCTQAGLATGACFPWVGVARAKSVAPYILDVEWGFEGGPLGGYGSRSRFVTVFGFVVLRQDRFGWAT